MLPATQSRADAGAWECQGGGGGICVNSPVQEPSVLCGLCWLPSDCGWSGGVLTGEGPPRTAAVCAVPAASAQIAHITATSPATLCRPAAGPRFRVRICQCFIRSCAREQAKRVAREQLRIGRRESKLSLEVEGTTVRGSPIARINALETRTSSPRASLLRHTEHAGSGGV